MTDIVFLLSGDVVEGCESGDLDDILNAESCNNIIKFVNESRQQGPRSLGTVRAGLTNSKVFREDVVAEV